MSITNKNYKNILLVNPFGIGDVLFTTPLVRNLKERFPECKIAYLCNKRAQEVLIDNPYIDKLFVYDRDEYVKSGNRILGGVWLKYLKLILEMKAHNFDLLIDFSLNSQYGFMALLAGIKDRLGYNYKGRGRFLTHKLSFSGYEKQHVVDYNFDLLRELDIEPKKYRYEIFLSEIDKSYAEKFCQSTLKTKAGRIVALAPAGGASWGKDAFRKQWSIDKWMELTELLLADANVTILLCSAPGEEQLSEKILSLDTKRVFSSQGMSIRQYCAVLSHADIAICNDGGPLHMAAALGVKTVSIFGPVDEKVYGPYEALKYGDIILTSNVNCRPCYQKFRLAECKNGSSCLESIAAIDVYNACNAVLGRKVKVEKDELVEAAPAKKKQLKGKSYRRFLIVNPFGIGDVVFTSPVLRAIKDFNTEAKIFYLSNGRTADMVRKNPLVEDVIEYDRDEYVKVKKESFFKWLIKLNGLIKQIREKDIDVVLDYSMNTYFGLFTLLAGISQRAGLNYKKRSKFLNKKISILGFDDKHVTEYYADVARSIGLEVNIKGLEFYCGEDANNYAEEFWKEQGLAETDVIGIAPIGGQAFGNDAAVKQWPKKSFAQLIDKILANSQKKVVLFGSPMEEDAVKEIVDLTKADKERIVMACQNTILQSAALIDKCELFVANDTGLLRIADGLNKKCVALFGPVDDNVYGLYPFDEKRHVLLCTKPDCWPCYKRFRLAECNNDYKCLRGIRVDDVLENIEKLLKRV